MKKKIKYRDEKIGKVEIIKDFLPKPEDLVFKEDTVKVTLNLSKSSIEFLKDNRVVFNIKGNSYRLIVKFNYKRQWAFIRFVGTHVEYDKINAEKI
ncbi:MAG: type II toxin-antitoxin system HigB family toxin [Bacteroidetes bacterium]|nr:type II toxin-antitoxin system HigB family toxin [Bacteroidota bacterium]